MATTPTNLNEYYASKGQALPTVSDRSATAAKAGIAGYTGTAEQNASLLGYLQNTPNNGNGNVITSESLAPEKQIQTLPATDTGETGLTGSVSALLASTKTNIDKEEADKAAKTAELAAKMKEAGDQGAFNEKVMQDQGVDTSKRVRDNYLSMIEAEQKSILDRVEQTRRGFRGTTAGADAEIRRMTRESANLQANWGIGLSAASRDYEQASSIANRLITANSDALKADIESRKFVLEQLGTELATNKANQLTLQLKQIDMKDDYYKTAIKIATDGAKDGSINGTTAFQAVQDLTAGKISLAEFYDQLGVSGQADGSNIGGSDVSSWNPSKEYATTIQSIYDTIPEFTTAEEADAAIKNTSPNSPITGQMLLDSAKKYGVDPKLMLAMLDQESNVGDSNVTRNNNNPSGITWSNTLQANFPNINMSIGTARPASEGGNYVKFNSMQDGLDFQAQWLKKHPSTNEPAYVMGRNPAADAWVLNIQAGRAKLSDITGNPRLKTLVSQGLAANGADPNTLLTSTKESLDELQKMIDDGDGFSGAVGAKGLTSFFGLKEKPLAGSKAADFATKFDQVQAEVVLPNLKLLRGLGAMSDREFKTLSSAATSLSLANSEEEFKRELKAITKTINDKLAEVGSSYGGVTLPADENATTYEGVQLPN